MLLDQKKSTYGILCLRIDKISSIFGVLIVPQKDLRPFLGFFFSVLRQFKIVKPTCQPEEKTNKL
jgi:hypothetical protein